MSSFRLYKSGVCVVWTDSSNAEAFCRLIAKRHAANPAAVALVYYSSDALNPIEVTSYLAQYCDDLNYCGCSTCGEISPAGMQDAGALAILLPASDFQVLCHPIENVHSAGMSNIAQKAAELRARFEELHQLSHCEQAFAITLIDGLTYSEEAVTVALHRGLGDIGLIGGSAGDNLHFNKTTQICNGRVFSNAAVLALINTSLPFALCTENNFIPTEKKLVVTNADPDTRTVYEFNAEPAALEYANLIGVERDQLDPHCFASNAMVVRVGGEYHCRAVQRVNDDDSLTFYSAIDTGVVLTVSKTEGMVDSMKSSINKVEQIVGEIDLVMGFECILRKLDARRRNAIGRVEDLYVENNIIAFNSYGEQYHSAHVNQTFTGVAFGVPSGAQETSA